MPINQPRPFNLYDIALLNNNNAYHIHLNGIVGATKTATDRTVWALDAAYTPFTAAKTLAISSSSASDTARVVDITYLDSDYNLQTGTLTTNGQNKVTSTIVAMRVLTAEYNNAAAQNGNIYIFDSTSNVSAGVPSTLTKVARYLPSVCKGDNTCHYTIPAGYTGLILDAGVAVMSTGSASTANDATNFCLRTAGLGTARLQPVRQAFFTAQISGSSTFDYNFPIPLKIAEKVDVSMNYLEATAANLKLETYIDLLIIKDGYNLFV